MIGKFFALVLMIFFLLACHTVPAPTAFDDALAKAQTGDADAQNRLALMYHYGQGVTQSYAAAYEWYSKAALQGVNEAQLNLGYMYSEGSGAVQDYRKAYVWYSIAAVEKNPLAGQKRDEIAKKMSAKELSLAKQDVADIRKKIESAKSPSQ